MTSMAKKKTGSRPPDNRLTIIVLKDSLEYREWFDSLSAATMIDSATIVRDAIAKWAKDRGLPDPPSGPVRSRRRARPDDN